MEQGRLRPVPIMNEFYVMAPGIINDTLKRVSKCWRKNVNYGFIKYTMKLIRLYIQYFPHLFREVSEILCREKSRGKKRRKEEKRKVKREKEEKADKSIYHPCL